MSCGADKRRFFRGFLLFLFLAGAEQGGTRRNTTSVKENMNKTSSDSEDMSRTEPNNRQTICCETWSTLTRA